MLSVIEREKVGKFWRDTVLYTGESEQDYNFAVYNLTRSYHSVKEERKDGNRITILKVN